LVAPRIELPGSWPAGPEALAGAFVELRVVLLLVPWLQAATQTAAAVKNVKAMKRVISVLSSPVFTDLSVNAIDAPAYYNATVSGDSSPRPAVSADADKS
jgi:hypothetical protein